MSVDKAKLLKEAQKFTQKGQYDKAVAAYQKLIEIDPGEKNYRNVLGDLYLKAGNQELAIRAFTDAAHIYQQDGFTPHTIALFKKILRIDPQRMEIYQELGKLYADQGLVGDAITNFKLAADHYFAKGMKQQALKIYKSIADLDPKNLNVKLRLAELYAKEGMRGEAASQYSNVAEKLAQSGKQDEALGYYTKARELQPENGDALRGLVNLCLTMDRPAQAIVHLEALKVAEPKNSQNLLLLGKTYLKVGKVDQALDTFEKVIALDPSQLQTYETLARLYQDRGDRSKSWHYLLPVIDHALTQNDKQTAGRLLDEFSSKLSEEKGFLQKHYDYIVQIGDQGKRVELGKRLATQYEKANVLEKAAALYKDLAVVAPQDRQINDKLRSLSSILEPQAPKISGPSLDIDLEQIDLSEIQDIGDVDSSSLDQIDVPIDLDTFGPPPPKSAPTTKSASPAKAPAPPTKAPFPQGKAAAPPPKASAPPSPPPRGSRSPAPAAPTPAPSSMVDVDLSDLDLGEGFGAAAPMPPPPPRQTIPSRPSARPSEPVAPTTKAKRPPSPSIEPPSFSAHSSFSFGGGGDAPPPRRSALDELSDSVDDGLTTDFSNEPTVDMSKIPFGSGPGVADLVDGIDDISAPIPPPPPPTSPPSVWSQEPFDFSAMPNQGFPPPGPHQPSSSSDFDMGELVVQPPPSGPQEELDLGEMFFGEKPSGSGEEENVGDLLRQLREGIESQVSKEDYDTHYNLGIAYKEMGLMDEAIDEFLKAAGDPSRRVSCWSNMGLCYAQRGLLDQAIGEFKKGLADSLCKDDDRVGLSYELGLVFEQKGDTAKAAEAFRMTAKVDSNFRDIKEKLMRYDGGPGNPKNRVSFL